VKGSHKLIIPLIIALAALMLVTSVWPGRAEATGPASASGPAAGATEQTPPGPAGIGLQAVIDSGPDIQLAGVGRLPRIALSTDGSRLAVVYQSGSEVHLKYTDGNATGWIFTPINIGAGSSPDLVFSGSNTLHVVWLGSSGGIPNRTVLHVSCTLNFTANPCGPTIHTVKADSGQQVTSPVIAFTSSGSNYLYAAWLNFGANQVQTASSTDNGATWPSTGAIAAGTLTGGSVALAAAGNTIHLAYTHDTGNVTVANRRIRYHKTTVPAHSWGTAIPAIGFGPDSNYTAVSNPDLAATSTAVFLTWDSAKNVADTYSLMGIASNNGGTSWDTPNPYYVTANIEFANGDDPRLTGDGVGDAPPDEEIGLRPSVAITGTNNFAVVWQQRPDSTCQPGEGPSDPPVANSTSEIHYATAAVPGLTPPGNWWTTTVGTLANVINTYSIDPDMVVNPTTKDRHIVFMQSVSVGCAGGGTSDYGIFYRGPFTKQQGGVFLPIVIKA
jgi:hypothetical protein